MGRGNTVIVNCSGGEVSPELYARLDLPIYQKGNQRVQNYIVLAQGGLQFRNAFANVKNTRNVATGRLLSFSFSEADTYVIELTAGKMRFYRNFGAILNSSSATITGVTKASPAVVTATSHGFTTGQEVFITGITGMKELNNQYFRVTVINANSFSLQNCYGANVDSSAFATYSSGGTATSVYELDVPYEAAHINDLHYKQSADTVIITSQKYPPFKLTRTGHTAWTIDTFVRTADPFNQKIISGITQANPGVFTTTTAHGFAVDDEIFVSNVVGMTQVNWVRYKVNSVPTTTTFTVKDFNTGTAVNTTGFTAYSSGGRVIQMKFCPKTLAFLDSGRLCYANWTANPAGLAFSRAPNSSTGATQFDDFTTGSNATDAILFTLAPIFDKLDSIQWVSNVNRQVVVGALSSVRRIHGDTIDDPITPSSISARPINSIGVAAVQPYSSGQSIFYVDGTGSRVQSFLFAIQSNDFVTVNQHLTANHLGASTFHTLAQQRSDAGLLWALRSDGVLTGLTFNELESIFGWHRHYLGGRSTHNSVTYDRAKVVSITVEPRLNQESVLWALVERTVGANTYRSVEYLKTPVKFVEIEDFLTDTGDNQVAQYEAQANDLAKYASATYEQLKDSIHVDSAVTYDGSALSSTITMTPSATSGQITMTASSAFFDSSMIGQEIWKKYDVRGNGGGRATITGVASSTQALCETTVDFDVAGSAIAAGSWLLTTNKVYGLLHYAGQELDLQLDGSPGGKVTVGTDGSVQLGSQTSKAHIGYKYTGIATTLNLDVAGDRGSAEAKIRKIREIMPRFHNTVGAKIGTTIWNAEPVTFRVVDDLPDRPVPIFQGIQHIIPQDSWTRQTKQAVLIQDVPSPQTLLSWDIMCETADD